jgi:glycerol uptake facilitator protein
LSIIGGETIGTALLILLGDGVVAAVLLNKSKAQNSGWIVITFGWAMGVMLGAYAVGQYTGAHLNPAVTLGLWVNGNIKGGDVPKYFVGEFLGAMIGAALVWVAYYGQFQAHMNDPEIAALAKNSDSPAGPVLGIFSTGPEIRNTVQNLATEIIGTFVLVLFILTLGLTKGLAVSGTGTMMVAFVVVGIGLSLGGPTGYAINPARDLGPRIVHALLPLPNKGGSDWRYAWIPVVGPIVGAALAAGLYKIAF